MTGLVLEAIEFAWCQPNRTVPQLDGISLSIPSGGSVSIMGASGVGKTTLCRVAAGLLRPASGRVLLDGREVLQPNSAITLSFQHYPCFPWLTVEQNILFGRPFEGVHDRSRTRIDRVFARQLIDRLSLASKANVLPHILSGGMQQRVSVARALAVRPRVLILDEPFSALDEETRLKAIDVLKQTQQDQQFVLITVLHDIADAVRTSQRIIYLSGSPARLVADVPVLSQSVDAVLESLRSAMSSSRY